MPGASEVTVRIALLGPPNVSWDGAPLVVPRRQARALLFRLASEAAPVPRAQLCFLFWPDEHENTAQWNAVGRAIAQLVAASEK
jgi:DNA-binding SARP family transcriptional activator